MPTARQIITSVSSDGYFFGYISTEADTSKSVRTKIREAWKDNLKNITVANGYHKTIREVNDPPKNSSNMSKFPAINLIWGTEDRENTHIQGNNSLVDVRLQVQNDVWIRGSKNLSDDSDEILQDIQKRFGVGTNYSVVDSSGKATAFVTEYVGCTPWGTAEEMSKGHGGITVTYDILYKYVLNNPTVSCG